MYEVKTSHKDINITGEDDSTTVVPHPSFGYVKFTRPTGRQQEIIHLYDMMKTLIEEAYKGKITIKNNKIEIVTKKFKIKRNIK